MIEVEGPDGTIIEFPDGTPDETIKGVMAKSFPAPQQQQPAAPMAAPQAAPMQQPQAPQDQRWGWQKALDESGLQTMKDLATGTMKGNIPFADEIVAGAMTPFGMAKGLVTGEDAGKGFMQRAGDNYNSALAFNRKTDQEAYDRSPIANTIGQVTGGVMTAGNLAKSGLTLLNPANPTVANMATRGAIEGGLYGGVYGFGEGEGLQDRLGKGAWGLGLGAATGGLTGAISGKLAQNTAQKTIPTANQIKSEADSLFKIADDAGIVMKPDKYSAAVDDIFSTMANKGFHPKMHSDANTALTALQELKGQPITLQSVKTMRELVSDLTASQKPKERLFGYMMRDKLDDLVNGITDADVIVRNQNITPQQASEALAKGRDLWGRMRRSEVITEALTKAERQASRAGSGGNIDNATRQKISSILDNPKRRRGFTPAETEAMENIVSGTTTQNILRQVGKLSPQGNGLSLLLHSLSAGAAIPTGGSSLLLQAPIAGVGMLAKRAADRATPANVRLLDALIRSGGQLPQAQISPAQRLIIQSLMAGQRQLPNPLQQAPAR